MLKIHKFITGGILALSSVFLFSSCGEMSEEIWINADGTTRYELQFDASEMLGMLAMMSSMEQLADSLAANEELSPEAKMQSLFKLDVLDTLINMRDVIPDSVRIMVDDRKLLRQSLEKEGVAATEAKLDSIQQAIAAMDLLSMTLKIDKPAEILAFGLRVQTDNVNEVSELFGTINGLNKMKPEQKASRPGSQMTEALSGMMEYKMVGNQLQIRASEGITQAEGYEQVMQNGVGMSASELEATLSDYGLESHTIRVHLPGKIQTVTGAAYLQISDNTVELKFDYAKLVRDQKDFAANIDFKPSKKYRVVLPKG